MKKLTFCLLSALFVMSLSSCDENQRKCSDPKKCPDQYPKDERHDRKW